MESVITEIVNLLTAGISGIASGVGTGVTTLAKAIFLTGEGTQASPYALSVFGGVIITFAAVGLAISLCRWVMMFITSLGSKK